MDSSTTTYSSVLVTPTVLRIRSHTAPPDSPYKPSPLRIRSRRLTSTPIKEDAAPLPNFTWNQPLPHTSSSAPQTSDISCIPTPHSHPGQLLAGVTTPALDPTLTPTLQSEPLSNLSFTVVIDTGDYTTIVATDEEKPVDVCSLDGQTLNPKYYNPRTELLYSLLDKQKPYSRQNRASLKRHRTSSGTNRGVLPDQPEHFPRRRTKTSVGAAIDNLETSGGDFGLHKTWDTFLEA